MLRTNHRAVQASPNRVARPLLAVLLNLLFCALALCALVARGGGLFWVWPVLAPAALAGLGALALAHRALAPLRAAHF